MLAAPPSTLFVLGLKKNSLVPGKLRLCALSSAGDKAEWLSRPSPPQHSVFGRFQREGEPKRHRDQQPDRVAERGELGEDSPRASPTPRPFPSRCAHFRTMKILSFAVFQGRGGGGAPAPCDCKCRARPDLWQPGESTERETGWAGGCPQRCSGGGAGRHLG